MLLKVAMSIGSHDGRSDDGPVSDVDEAAELGIGCRACSSAGVAKSFWGIRYPEPPRVGRNTGEPSMGLLPDAEAA